MAVESGLAHHHARRFAKFGSKIGNHEFHVLIGRIGAVKSSAFHFLNPFFGVGIAALLLGETITGLDMIGVAIAAGGILAVQLARIRGAGA